MLQDLGATLVDRLETKYELAVEVSAPTRDTSNVDTWKFKVITHPEQRDLPAQRINIDICSIPSEDRRPMVLRNHYGVDMGTAGLIIQAQTREEILADKLVALALRPNRLKNRDLWDIGWLKQQNLNLPLDMIPGKVDGRQRKMSEFLTLLTDRRDQLQNDRRLRADFIQEIKRFLPPRVVAETIENEAFWEYLVNLITIECDAVIRLIENGPESTGFKM